MAKLAFAGSPFEAISVQELIQQIESRKRIEVKLPLWFATPNIYYPPKLNLEQTSSESTAGYKSNLISGGNMADITGGFGVDAYFFSKKVDRLDHFELNLELAEIAAHNFKVLGCKNCDFYVQDGIKGIVGKRYDLIYLDPSRRSDSKGKVFFLEDCIPNVPDVLPLLFESSERVLVKSSPMLDITAGIRSLPGVAEVHIIAVQNEVKELLWDVRKSYNGAIKIKTINSTKEKNETFDFEYGSTSEVHYGLPMDYLYEPNAAIMKSGSFTLIGKDFALSKLHLNTHLYTSNRLVDFPGRTFKILSVFPYSKKTMHIGITFDQANIATRNFPESVSQLRKKWKIKDGGDRYIFFTTSGTNEKLVLICEKITK